MSRPLLADMAGDLIDRCRRQRRAMKALDDARAAAERLLKRDDGRAAVRMPIRSGVLGWESVMAEVESTVAGRATLSVTHRVYYRNQTVALSVELSAVDVLAIGLLLTRAAERLIEEDVR